MEIVVVDNGPAPTVEAIVAGGLPTGDHCPPRVVREPRKGLDRARNRGIAASTGDVIAFIDDDCEVDPGWATALLDAFANPTVDCVTGRVVPGNEQLDTAQWVERRYSFDRGKLAQRFHHSDVRRWFPVYPHHLGTGCNMAFRRALLERIGDFDPALDMGSLVGGGGDIDMFARTLDVGAWTAYEPEAVVRHHHRERRDQLVYQFFGYGATTSALTTKWVLRRHGRRLQALAFMAWYFGDTVRGGLRDAARRARRSPGQSLPLWLHAAEFLGELWGPFGYLLGVLRNMRQRR
jgi:glycosyltransferase involved in cell wall biosynthesis